MRSETASVTEQEEQLVVFELAGESYGVDIGAVNTIIRMQQITHVPRAPEYVEGVINLRGNIIPVVDLRKRFGLEAREDTKASRIVVVETLLGAFGLIVDAVTETLTVSRGVIEPPSSIVATADSRYLRGVAKLEGRLIILLEIEQIVAALEGDDLTEDDLTEAVPAFSQTEEPVAATAVGPAEGLVPSNPSPGKPKRSRTNGKRAKATAKVAVAAR